MRAADSAKTRCMKKTFLLFAVLFAAISLVVAQNQVERRERARSEVIKQIEVAWRSSGTNEPLRLLVIVIGNAQEESRLFPRGVRHLPETLTPRVIYCCDPECTRSAQYIGKARRDGITFAVFRRWGGDWRD